jgi:outer membrane protein
MLISRYEGDRRGVRRGVGLCVSGLAALVAAMLSAQTTAGPTAPLALSDALNAVAVQSEAAVAAGIDLEAARQQTERARAPYRPSVSLSGNYMARDNQIVALFGALSAPTTDRDFFSGELDATYLLWDGGRRASALEASRRGEVATEQRGKAGVQAAVLEGLATYLRVLVLDGQKEVLRQRAASLGDHLRVAQDLYDHGVVARSDLLETEVRQRLVQDQQSQLDNGVAVARQTLNRLMGRDPDAALELPARLTPPPLPQHLDELERRAADSSPRLQALRAQLAAQQAGVAVHKAEDYPTAIAQATHTYEQNRYLLYPNANFLLLGLSWQAFDGGARKAALRQAELAVAKTKSEIGDLTRSIEIELDRAYRDLEQARREEATAEVNVGAAEENLRMVEDQYKAGLARTTDVLDAESVLAESRFAVTNQRYTAFLQEGVVMSLAGEDLPAFFAAVKER